MKHAEIIRAWLDGVKIEFRTNEESDWYPIKNAENTTEVEFKDEWQYRIKPIEIPKYIPLACLDGYHHVDGVYSKTPEKNNFHHNGELWPVVKVLKLNFVGDELMSVDVLKPEET